MHQCQLPAAQVELTRPDVERTASISMQSRGSP